MPATDAYLLLRALVDELARCGMTDACTCPGSRDTPIVLTLARDPRLRAWSHVDERCAGFFALGAAKASGRPVAVTCTSGTAAANLAPAVIEAWEAGVPLIVLTADRPPELREIGAGQTIDQTKLYGGAVKWFFDLGVPEATPARMRWVRTLACRVYATAVSGRPGPVHLNVPLREPLVLGGAELPEDTSGRADGRPYVVSMAEPPPGEASLTDIADIAGNDGERGGGARLLEGRVVIVAGAGGDGAEIAAFAVEAGVPLLADPLSGARRGETAVAHYDLLLRDQAFAETVRPASVLRVGDLPTSKPLRSWLAGLPDSAQIAFDPLARWQDPGSVVGMRVAGSLPHAGRRLGDPDYLATWRAADSQVADALRAPLADSVLSEPAVAATLCDELPADTTLYVASSMPIRDVEEFAAVRDDPPRVLANRGANGIDGTVSSAFGAAAVSDGPVVLLIGDLAVAHDAGGLLAARRTGLPLTIVLLNNDGGGIFHFLPVAEEGQDFERHIATPAGLDFAALAAAYGVRHELTADLPGFREALTHGLGHDGTTLVEVRTDRVANRELHRELESVALAALRSQRYKSVADSATDL